MGTMSVPSRTLCLTLEVANGDIWFFERKRLEPKRVAMATALRVSFCFFCNAHLWCQVSRTPLRYFYGNCLSSILPFFSCKQYDVITAPICITEKHQYLENEK